MAYGDCQDNVLSYFYKADASACEAFYYSGCGGNGNRFETEEQCERQCGSYRGVGKFDSSFVYFNFYLGRLAGELLLL